MALCQQKIQECLNKDMVGKRSYFDLKYLLTVAQSLLEKQRCLSKKNNTFLWHCPERKRSNVCEKQQLLLH